MLKLKVLFETHKKDKMTKLKLDINKMEKLVRKAFPNSKIQSIKNFSTGLVSPAFKVKIYNPEKIIVVKLSKLKIRNNIHKNNKILRYLNESSDIPVPKVYFEIAIDSKFITVMDYSAGEVATKIYKKTSTNLKKKILFSAGENLRKIHKLKAPPFWIHNKHEIRNEREWKKWTKLRIDKYLNFFRVKLKDYFRFLEKELNEFENLLEREEINIVPLHWDYHLSNINVSSKGEITGIFDFDNAMKGHNLADIGQVAYWMRFECNDNKNFNEFLKGYNKNKFTKKELKLIRGYFILHLLAVSRSVWLKKKLSWIINKHKKILDEMKDGVL